jgi:hydrogenase-4 component F
MGLAVIGIAVGGIALYGALVLIVAHAFAKSAAFYCSGDVLRATGTTRIDEVRNLGRRMPWTSGVWILSSAAVTGAPPFGTFLGELLIVVGALAIGLVWVAGVVVVAILVAFLGVNSQIGSMIFGEPRSAAESGSKLPDDGWGIAGLNVAFALILGVAAVPYLAAGLRAAASLLGGAHP